MFNWFRPRCPVDAKDKTWIESRLRWLALEFGIDRLLDATAVLPTPDFFPDPYDGGKKSIRRMLERVCEFMRISPQSIRLELYAERYKGVSTDGLLHGSAGLYEASSVDPLLNASYNEELHGGGRWYGDSEKTVIRINRSTVDDPTVVVATLAHEPGHALLLGEGRISAESKDHEPLTDLLTIFLGLGVFTANSRIRCRSGYPGRLGYLGQPQTGYALALFAWLRGEPKPEWAKHLCLDVRTALKKGVRYLFETGDSSFDPTERRAAAH
jgi:hypothetical protein